MESMRSPCTLKLCSAGVKRLARRPCSKSVRFARFACRPDSNPRMAPPAPSRCTTPAGAVSLENKLYAPRGGV